MTLEVFEVEVLQPGPPVGVDLGTPALEVDLLQSGEVVTVDLASEPLELEVLQVGAVHEVWVVEGPPGPPGTPDPGAYFATFNFASAALEWVIALPAGVSSYATNVDTLTAGGAVIRGEVQRPNASTIVVSWYYPTAGVARVYR